MINNRGGGAKKGNGATERGKDVRGRFLPSNDREIYGNSCIKMAFLDINVIIRGMLRIMA